jgi:hypothetical protein
VASKQRFPGLKLDDESRSVLWQRERAGAMGMLVARRIHILRLLDQGRTLTEVATAADTYRREVRRVGWRYLEGGVEHALTDEPRRKCEPMLDPVAQAAIVALACGPAPEGRARWTLRLLAAEAKKRRIVRSVSHETIRQALADQEVKPWREKNVVRP